MAATFVQAQSENPIVSSRFSWAWLEKVSEYFWFSLCLLLFMALGPFSAPIVLGYIFFGKLNEHGPGESNPAVK